MWHWSEKCVYDKENGTSGLFSSYVDQWLKLKQESSGYPFGVTTPEQKREYIENFAKTEGINLEEDKIAFNAGMRTISKLLLNSMWGVNPLIFAQIKWFLSNFLYHDIRQKNI